MYPSIPARRSVRRGRGEEACEFGMPASAKASRFTSEPALGSLARQNIALNGVPGYSRTLVLALIFGKNCVSFVLSDCVLLQNMRLSKIRPVSSNRYRQEHRAKAFDWPVSGLAQHAR
ncbi:hypothetical protein OBBRIDRAFT_35716 [Obba rivulosa]|uniref:Uncharacterized protein n=1 Tax=Obba rivulosa TaxID=1052685 RepID=A0A8E2AVP1_9APHY|nr:hypothetical protein OBBRIDRAFT_35716 [Obba rivulosa]